MTIQDKLRIADYALSNGLVIGKLFESKGETRPSLDRIIDVVWYVTGISPDQMRDRDRHKEIVSAKRIFLYLANHYYTHKEVGAHINIHRATVIHHVNRINDMVGDVNSPWFDHTLDSKINECLTLLIENESINNHVPTQRGVFSALLDKILPSQRDGSIRNRQ